MLTFQFLQKSIIRTGEKFTIQNYRKNTSTVQLSVHQNNRVINPQIIIIIKSTKHCINPFVPNAPFLYPLKALENRKVALGMGALGTNGIIEEFSGE